MGVGGYLILGPFSREYGNKFRDGLSPSPSEIPAAIEDSGR